MFPAASACYALGRLGDRRALPLLVCALDDPDLTFNAAKALAALTKTGDGWDSARWKTWWAEQNAPPRQP
jgi:HEAT repeat protein